MEPEPRYKRARIVGFVVLVMAILGTFGGGKMGWITNVATDERVVPVGTDRAVAAVRSAAAAMPRWTQVKDDGRSFGWEARTKLLGFVDDVTVDVVPEGASSTRLRLRSASRVGLSDWGTNGRRLRAFVAAVDEQLR